MKKSFKLTVYACLAIIATAFFFSFPKDSKADVIVNAMHEEYFVCADGTEVMRCKLGGTQCNVSNQELCPDSPL